MTATTPLDLLQDAIEVSGGRSRLAARLNLSETIISLWTNGIRPMPSKYADELSSIVTGESCGQAARRCQDRRTSWLDRALLPWEEWRGVMHREDMRHLIDLMVAYPPSRADLVCAGFIAASFKDEWSKGVLSVLDQIKV